MNLPRRLAPVALLASACSTPPPASLDATVRDAAADAVLQDLGVEASFDGGAAVAPFEIANEAVRVSVRTAPFGLRVATADGRTLLDTSSGSAAPGYAELGATTFDVSSRPVIVEGWDHAIFHEDPWVAASHVVSAMHDATHATVDVDAQSAQGTGMRVTLTLDGAELRVDVTARDANARNRFGQSFALGADEHFFGLGERYDGNDHRGRTYECWVEEGGVGGGEHTPLGPHNPAPNGPSMTSLPVPFLLSTRGYGLWLETTRRTGFVLGTDDPAAWRIYTSEGRLTYRIFVHDDPRATLARFTELTGRAPLPAPWVFGPRRRVDHGVMVGGIPEEEALRVRHVPTTMVDDTTHFLPNGFDETRTAFLHDWTTQMHASGFKTVAYFNPHVSVSNPVAAPLLAYGRAHGLFVRTRTGTEFQTQIVSAGLQTVATIDFTNPDARAWFQSLQQRALDLGYDGWMLDFGEYLASDAQLFDGTPGDAAHNLFPVLVQTAAFEGLQRARGDDFMFFVRSGYTGTQAHTPIVWSGDPSASFDPARGLPAQVRAAMSAGLSGIPFWGSDVSGYTCLNDPPPDKDVYLRWAAFGAFSSDMHDENACSQRPAGAPEKWTLWSDDETTRVYGSYARLHTRLNPYLYAAAQEAHATGMPVVRHPVLVNPTLPGAWSADASYWFGPALYVAPVIERAATTRTFWLPPGVWFDWWTGARVDGAGGMVTRDAPFDRIPVLLRSGSLVAMLDASVETLAPDTRADVISAQDVAGLYDVRGAVDASAPSASATLADGTALTATLGTGALALPTGWTDVSDEATLAACTACGHVTVGSDGVRRVRLNPAAGATAAVVAGGLTVRQTSAAGVRVRWDIAVP